MPDKIQLRDSKGQFIPGMFKLFKCSDGVAFYDKMQAVDHELSVMLKGKITEVIFDDRTGKELGKWVEPQELERQVRAEIYEEMKARIRAEVEEEMKKAKKERV